VYFSPYGRGAQELQDQTADTVYAGEYGCKDPNRGYSAATLGADGHPIETLAGWSSGRQGVSSFLGRATEAELRQLSYVLLIDPGDLGELKCDRDVRTGNRLARWLNTNTNARLVVISGNVSQRRNSQGLVDTYLDPIRKSTRPGMNTRSRVLICNYGIGHHAAFVTAQWWILHRIGGGKGSCPPLRESNGKTYRTTRAWHP
jgi:hypothetical protein